MSIPGGRGGSIAHYDDRDGVLDTTTVRFDGGRSAAGFTNLNDQHAFLEVPEQLQIGLCAVWSFGVPSPSSRKIQHMEDGYTQLGTVLTDQRPEDSEGDGVIVVGRFKGDPYDGVQLSYKAGRRNLYLTLEGALRLAFLLAAAVDRDIDIR